MSNSSSDVKSSKPAFSYARAAQGSNVPTPTAMSPQPNGKQASTTDDKSAASNTIVVKGADEKLPESASAAQASTNHKSQSSISSAAGNQASWAQKGSGVHMPPRTGPASGNASNPVQFGNFVDEANAAKENSPVISKASTPAASGGTAPPAAIMGKDVPQFGSVPATTTAADIVSSAWPHA